MKTILVDERVGNDMIVVEQAKNGAHSILVNGVVTVFALSANLVQEYLDAQVKLAYQRAEISRQCSNNIYLSI